MLCPENSTVGVILKSGNNGEGPPHNVSSF